MRQKGLMLCSEFWKVYKVAGNKRNKEECYGDGYRKESFRLSEINTKGQEAKNQFWLILYFLPLLGE